jgi:hypothetical protein
MWPISVRSWRIGIASRTLMYNAPSSASAAEDILGDVEDSAVVVWVCDVV